MRLPLYFRYTHTFVITLVRTNSDGLYGYYLLYLYTRLIPGSVSSLSTMTNTTSTSTQWGIATKVSPVHFRIPEKNDINSPIAQDIRVAESDGHGLTRKSQSIMQWFVNIHKCCWLTVTYNSCVCSALMFLAGWKSIIWSCGWLIKNCLSR